MGFLSGLLDFIAELGNVAAKKIDNQSDDEIETRSLNNVMKSGNINDYKTADEMRDAAAKAHEFYEQRKNKKEDNK